MAEMLKLEVDTMVEDCSWRYRMSFRKSYFTTVRGRTDYREPQLTSRQLKQFVTKEQATKKVFPPGGPGFPVARMFSHHSSGRHLLVVAVLPAQGRACSLIGQDPYHDDNQAHVSTKQVTSVCAPRLSLRVQGLAFSVRKGMRIPPSLRKQLQRDGGPGARVHDPEGRRLDRMGQTWRLAAQYVAHFVERTRCAERAAGVRDSMNMR